MPNSLSSDVGGAPALTYGGTATYTDTTVGGQADTVLNFGAGTGLTFSNIDAGNGGANYITNEYTIVLAFEFDDPTGGYDKILDFQNLGSDDGLYRDPSGYVTFYPETGTVSVTPNTYFEVALSRNAATQEVKAYVNGALSFSFIDDGNLGVFNPGNPLIFFKDDTVTGNEISAGSIARLQLYNTLLTDTEVGNLNLVSGGGTPVPFTPGSTAGVVILGGLWWAKQRQRSSQLNQLQS